MTPDNSTTVRSKKVRSPITATALVAGLACTQLLVDGAPTNAHTWVPSESVQEALPKAPARLPDLISVRRGVHQMVTVTSPSFGSTKGTLRAWHRPAGGQWSQVRRPIPVVIGYNGWVRAADRRQSTGTTPAGIFTMPYAFGRWANPGAHLGYRRVDGDDYWPYDRRDPATYNVYQRHKAKRTHWRSQYVEHLDSYRKQYGYAIVVGFNLPSGVHYSKQRRQWVAREPADKRAGGGIFLHVRGDGLTAGCVAMSIANMEWLTRWVRPGATPRLVMGPRSYVVRL